MLGSPRPGAALEDGFQYLEMRDGVTLSAMVRFPDAGLYGAGPYPTVIEYSGYSPSNPAAEEPGVRLARAFGYATVSVNLRGSGCSGGVFDIFNPAQQADGYDIVEIVEIVGRQPWALGQRAGMVGLSCSGITQLYTASTRPPHLAAVLPQSVITDPFLQQRPGAFQDEQTGPQFTSTIDHFDRAPVRKVGLWNGRHPDGYAPSNIVRWFGFLEFYVAGPVPRLNPVIRAAAPPLLASAFGLQDTELEADRWYDRFGDDLGAARAAYEAEDDVRVVLESGIGGNELGEPVGTEELTFETWPPSEADRQTWFLGADERLTTDRPSMSSGGVDAFRLDPEDAELWVTSDSPDPNVQVSISEVQPDGVEYLLQNGWLRVGHRRVDRSRSDRLEITHTFRERDFRALEPGEYVRSTIEIPAVAHVLRTGSRLRLSVSTPGRNHATWEFENPYGEGPVPTQHVARTRFMASKLVLPLLRGVDAADLAPAPCPGLRGMACRPFVPVTNEPAALQGVRR